MGKLRLTWFVVIATLRDFKNRLTKKEQKKEEFNLTRYHDPLNFIELDNPEFIQLLRDLVDGRCLLCRCLVLIYISSNIFNKFNAGE